MGISYNTFILPTATSYTPPGGTAQSGMAFTGSGGTTVQMLGTGNAGIGELVYDKTNVVLQGILNAVRVSGNSNDYSVTGFASSDLMGRINAFIAGSIQIANTIGGWLTTATAHLDTSSIVYGGTTMSVAMRNSSNVIVGYLKMTGTGLTSTGLSKAVITSVQHEDATHTLVPGDLVTYGTAGKSANFLMYGLLKVTDSAFGDAGVLGSVFNAKNEIYTAHNSTSSMDGGLGNDTYELGSYTATIVDSAGIDKIVSTVTRSLASLATIENLTLTGSAVADGTGNALANVIIGNAGANTLTGAVGNDTLDGAGGNDTLRGGDGNDALTGGLGNDAIYGDGGIDFIRGGDGNDTVYGGIANDQIFGDAGNDIIHGGAGRDSITGGAGADTFVFDASTDSGALSSSRDYIADFIHNQTPGLSDRIDLSAIDASTKAAGNNNFVFLGKGVFTGVAGQLHYKLQDLSGSANDRTFIEGDTNGDKIVDFQIELNGIKALVAADFIL